MVAAEAPNVADWMQGIGAVASLPLSLGALIFTGWLLRHEISVRREERDDRLVAQARLVRIVGTTDVDADGRVGFRIWNGSADPIYAVNVRHIREDAYTAVVERLNPGEEAVGWSQVVVLPGKVGGTDLQLKPYIILFFEDAEGNSWERPAFGRPRRPRTFVPLRQRSLIYLLSELVRTSTIGAWLTRRTQQRRGRLRAGDLSTIRRFLVNRIESNKPERRLRRY